MSFKLETIFENCGYPVPSDADLEGWSELAVGDTTTAVVKLGLFGYDASCLASVCAQASNAGAY